MRHSVQFRTLAIGLACLLILIGGQVCAQAPSFNQAVTCASGESPYRGGPQTLATDAVGNTYAAGRFSVTITLGTTVLTALGVRPGPGLAAPGDVFVAKLDAAGRYQWAAQVGGSLEEEVSGVATDAAGDVYVTGYFQSFSIAFGGLTLFNSSANREIYVAKLSGATGQWLWARRAGGTSVDVSSAIAVNATGDVYVAGSSFHGPADFGAFTLTSSRFGDAFIAKLSPTGTWLWARKAGSGSHYIGNLFLDAQSNILMGGVLSAPSATFGSTTLSTRVIAGTSSLTGGELFVAKYTDTGNWLWAVQGDAVSNNNLIGGVSMAFDGLNHLYVTGSYRSTAARIGSTILPNLSAGAPGPYPNNYYSDAFVARLNANTGAWQWAIRAGGLQDDELGTIAADGQGRVYVAAGSYGVQSFENPLPGGGRVQLAQLDGATGAWRWTLPLPDAAAHAVVHDGLGGLRVGGYFSGATAAFGATILAQAGPSMDTGYLARLGAGPLASRPAGGARAGLEVWPNPSERGPVHLQGPAAGQPVQVLDVLGRTVATGRMPATGPLTLPLALPAGVYVVRAGRQARQLVVE